MAVPSFAVERPPQTDPRFQLAERFRSDPVRYVDWPAEQCAHHMSELCAEAGRLMFPVVRDHGALFSQLPDWMRRSGGARRDPQSRSHDRALWWLAFVGWLETQSHIPPGTTRGVSFHREVFVNWRPELQFYKYPYLAFHPGLCKAYGLAACSQSAVAIEFVLNDARRALDAVQAPSCGPPTAPEVLPDAQPDPVPQPAAPAAPKFVGSTQSDLYHHPECLVARRISRRNRVIYTSKPAGKRLHRSCPVGSPR